MRWRGRAWDADWDVDSDSTVMRKRELRLRTRVPELACGRYLGWALGVVGSWVLGLGFELRDGGWWMGLED